MNRNVKSRSVIAPLVVQVERETVGDTTIVRTVSGMVWDEPRALVPEVSIGVLDGAEEYMLGQVNGFDVDDHLDEESVAYFDPHGTVPRSVVLVFGFSSTVSVVFPTRFHVGVATVWSAVCSISMRSPTIVSPAILLMLVR